MGLAQSHADFFHDANQVDGDQIEIYDYLRRAEQVLWRHEPWWDQQDYGTAAATNRYRNGALGADSSKEPSALVVASDPAKPLVRVVLELLDFEDSRDAGECLALLRLCRP